jgi:hypothetical protein
VGDGGAGLARELAVARTFSHFNHTPIEITSLNGDTVRSFPTHGQLSTAQGSPTTVSA